MLKTFIHESPDGSCLDSLRRTAFETRDPTPRAVMTPGWVLGLGARSQVSVSAWRPKSTNASFAEFSALASVAALQSCRVHIHNDSMTRTASWHKPLSPQLVTCIAAQSGIRLVQGLVKGRAEIIVSSLACSLAASKLWRLLIEDPLHHLLGELLQVLADVLFTHGASLSSTGTHVKQAESRV